MNLNCAIRQWKLNSVHWMPLHDTTSTYPWYTVETLMTIVAYHPLSVSLVQQKFPKISLHVDWTGQKDNTYTSIPHFVTVKLYFCRPCDTEWTALGCSKSSKSLTSHSSSSLSTFESQKWPLKSGTCFWQQSVHYKQCHIFLKRVRVCSI